VPTSKKQPLYHIISQTMNPYAYQSDVPQTNIFIKEETPEWRHYSVEFPSAFPTEHKKSNTVLGEYYQPVGKNTAPLVIMAHGIGDQTIIPCRFLARSLAKQGIASFVLYLVFHSSRMAETTRKHLPNLSPEEWFSGYQASVIDIRQVADWAHSRSELDSEKVASLGISLGGFVSAIAMGVDSRIKAGIFIVSGGNSEKMNRLSKADKYRTGSRRTEAEYQLIQSTYTEYLAEVARQGLENVTPPRQSFLTDPLTFSSYLKQRPILMLNALWDKYIPREATLDFWQACGRPPLKWFPSGHASIWFWYPVISRQISSFFRSTFRIAKC